MNDPLQNYYRDKTDDVDDNALDGKSFKYKTKIVGKAPKRPPHPPEPPQTPDGIQPPQPQQPAVPTSNAKVTIPPKYLSNFRRFLYLLVINCEKELDLSCIKDCVLIEHHSKITGATFQINNAKLYVPVVTLKQGFKRTISWNKHRSEIITQLKNNDLDYLTDLTFRNINRLHV